MPLLQVRDLRTSFHTRDGIVRAVDGISFDVGAGETVGIVGESGSGKSVCCYSLLRLIPQPPGRIEGGTAMFGDLDLLQLSETRMRKVRGKRISLIFQDPMTSLNPYLRISTQLIEPLLLHERISPSAALARAIAELEAVGIPDAKNRIHSYPHEFSGGMRQRVMIAMALILHPKLIIADEPTTALDVTLQSQIFDLILERKAADTSILFITHDMGVIWELADRVIVMKDGRIIERGEVEPIFAQPGETYTRELLASVPRLTDAPRAVTPRDPSVEPILEVKDLKTWFPVKRGVFARTVDWVKAVDEVSVDIFPGECLGLVGESGSGKTTLGRSILGLETSQEGEILFEGSDIRGLGYHAMRPLRRNLQMIFQDPYSSLNPRLTVLEILTEGLIEHGMLQGDRREVAARWLEEVGLDADTMNRYPHEFSGGQRQRICVARAVAMEPKFVVCDEAVSALDVTIQAQVIDLLMELKDKLGLSYLFISHDLSVVKRICDRVVVMRHGKVVEAGQTIDLVERPASDYTKNLIAAVPVPGDPAKRMRRATAV